MSGIMLNDELPIGWQIAKLGDILDVIRGISFPKEAKKDKFGEGLIACLRTANVQKQVDWKDLWFVNESYVKRSEQIILKNDILISTANSLEHLGKVALVKKPKYKATLGTFIVNLRVPDNLIAEFIYYYLSTTRFKNDVQERASTTTNISNISTSQLRDIGIIIAPLIEQRYIVQKLEELFYELDKGVEAHKTIQQKLKVYRQAVLKWAFEGKLTNELRKQKNLPSAGNLMQHIMKEQVEYEKTTGKKARKNNHTEKANSVCLDIDLPEGWCWARLGDFAVIKGGITKDSKRLNYNCHEVPYLRVANVQRGYLDLTEIKTIFASNEEIAELRLQKGDVLFNEGGDRDKLGRGWVWNNEISDCIHQNHVFRARFNCDLINSKFISYYSNSFGQNYFLKEGKQTTNLASINLTKLSNLPIPIPSTQEQKVIVQEIESRLSVADKLEETIEQNLRQIEVLRQSILKKAFAGQLLSEKELVKVHSDHDWEPASVLLERIKAQNSKVDPKKNGKRGKKQI